MIASEPLLSVRELSVAFRHGARETLAVDRISFAIGRGETLALVGESGSGKSVTALSILKLLPYPAARHPSGAIRFKGEELLGLPEAKIRHVRGNAITIIFQEPMTLEEIFKMRRPPYRSAEDIDASIRRLRDEWDD